MWIVFILLKIWVSISGKYSQKHIDLAKKSSADVFKTASIRTFKKTAKATVDWIENKFADKITTNSKNLITPAQTEDLDKNS